MDVAIGAGSLTGTFVWTAGSLLAISTSAVAVGAMGVGVWVGFGRSTTAHDCCAAAVGVRAAKLMMAGSAAAQAIVLPNKPARASIPMMLLPIVGRELLAVDGRPQIVWCSPEHISSVVS